MATGGKLIVITAPVTETIDHAGYFIQMALASLPIWLERILDSKYPKWRELERNEDGSAKYMPAGVRTVEAALLREYRAEDIACCYPDDLEKFIGPDTRVVAVSTHNPLGVTFAVRTLVEAAELAVGVALYTLDWRAIGRRLTARLAARRAGRLASPT